MTPRTFGPSPSRRRAAGYALAVVGTGLLVPLLLSLREDVDVLTLGWGFLAWVVIVAAVGGLGPGIAASFLAFGVYNFYFFPPFHTFRVAEPEHIVVLFVFLGVSVLIAVLLASARARAKTAQARERELRLQQDLATALVDPSPDNERYGLVLRLIVTQLRLDLIDLYVTPGSGSGLDLLTTVMAGEPRTGVDRVAGAVGERCPRPRAAPAHRRPPEPRAAGGPRRTRAAHRGRAPDPGGLRQPALARAGARSILRAEVAPADGRRLRGRVSRRRSRRGAPVRSPAR